MKHAVLKFPVCSVMLMAGMGCGFEPVYGQQRPETRLSVASERALVPYPEAVLALNAGVQRELSRAGVLRSSGYPQLRVQLVRVDESPSAIAATAGVGEPSRPEARGAAIGVVARGWVLSGPAASPANETGDLRRVARYGQSRDASLEQLQRDAAIRRAAHNAGRAAARSVLGLPTARNELM